MYKNLKLAGIFLVAFAFNISLLLLLFSRISSQNRQTKLLDEITQAASPENQFAFSAAPLVLGEVAVEAKLVDSRVANLRNFFRTHNSPLYEVADIVVRESDANGLDYRLLPAIAMQESNLALKMPENSFNPFGWGITGSKVTRFASFEEAVITVARGIKEQYVEKRGLKTASEIMSVYTPASDGSWAYAVNHFMRSLE